MTDADEKMLRGLDRQTILALANSLHAIAKAQVSAGKKLTAEEQEIFNRVTAQLPSLNRS
ncbi:hypothetical protein [Comamonas thiooxydans]|uniref:hypothetical protein n=1 Tax=Comamonas thiooxydans TaxID=363952 RepID=UPI0015A734E6|nr:hypothetical protein [Comamonas thiooxydans]